jgi:hypothetical protein
VCLRAAAISVIRETKPDLWPVAGAAFVLLPEAARSREAHRFREAHHFREAHRFREAHQGYFCVCRRSFYKRLMLWDITALIPKLSKRVGEDAQAGGIGGEIRAHLVRA